MWFCPVKNHEEHRLLRRVMNITDVVAACRETGLDWFEQLLENVGCSHTLDIEVNSHVKIVQHIESERFLSCKQLLKKEEDSTVKPVEKACSQLISCLVENVLSLEEKGL